MAKYKRALFLAAAAVMLAGCGRRLPKTPAPQAPAQRQAFGLASDSFSANSDMPADLTCDGKNLSPQLRWTNVPAGAASLALVVRDPDSPSGEFLHWAVVDIPAAATGLEPGGKPPAPARELRNDAGRDGYFGPCPPSGRHRYVFTLYALDAGSYAGGQARLEDHLESRALGKAVLTGLYQRKK